MGYKLHVCFQNQGVMPGVVLGLRSQSDPALPGETTFVLASTSIALDEGDVPIKVRNFPMKKGEKKG